MRAGITMTVFTRLLNPKMKKGRRGDPYFLYTEKEGFMKNPPNYCESLKPTTLSVAII